MQRPWRSSAYCLAPHGLLRLLSYNTQDHCPGLAPLTVSSALPYQSRGYTTTGLPAGQASGGIVSIKVPSSQMALVCVKLTEKSPAQQHPANPRAQQLEFV